MMKYDLIGNSKLLKMHNAIAVAFDKNYIKTQVHAGRDQQLTYII